MYVKHDGDKPGYSDEDGRLDGHIPFPAQRDSPILPISLVGARDLAGHPNDDDDPEEAAKDECEVHAICRQDNSTQWKRQARSSADHNPKSITHRGQMWRGGCLPVPQALLEHRRVPEPASRHRAAAPTDHPHSRRTFSEGGTPTPRRKGNSTETRGFPNGIASPGLIRANTSASSRTDATSRSRSATGSSSAASRRCSTAARSIPGLTRGGWRRGDRLTASTRSHLCSCSIKEFIPQ